jgi:hypothetical protein
MGKKKVIQQEEGIIKFQQIFIKKQPLSYETIGELNCWRGALFLYGLIGRDPKRYNGAAYGNVSQRIEPYDAPIKKRKFIITGTQTGKLEELTEEHYTTVVEYNYESNSVVTEGPIKASSESMTHGSMYDCDKKIRYVFHVHAPSIWKDSKKLSIPTTKKNVEYGTPEMAEEVKRLFEESNVKKKRIFSMGGHEDGIVTFGKTTQEAGKVLMGYFLSSLIQRNKGPSKRIK